MGSNPSGVTLFNFRLFTIRFSSLQLLVLAAVNLVSAVKIYQLINWVPAYQTQFGPYQKSQKAAEVGFEPTDAKM